MATRPAEQPQAPIATRFQGRAAIVTGGSSGIGLATARRLAREGAHVVLVSRDAAQLREAAADFVSDGLPEPLPQPCDVGEEQQIAAAVQACIERFGRLDVVVNNAAYMPHANLAALSVADFERTLRINLLGPFLFTRHAFERMGEEGGAIVNVASVHAYMAQPGAAAYASSKAAMLALTRAAAIEGRSRGIRANAVVPGAVDTPMLWSNPKVASGEEKLNPADIGQPEDIAAAVAWLASSEARFVTGAALAADGGRLATL